MADAEVLALRQDMTITRDDLLRRLPAVVGHVPFAVAAADIRGREAGRAWRISVVALPDLRLGTLRLSRQRVSIFLTGYDAAATRRFLERFELHFRRGGG